jgi:hypothetical protein
MATPIYFVREGNALYRRSDGNPDLLPDEVLWRSGWNTIIGPLTVSPASYPRPSRVGGPDGGADPLLGTMISVIPESEAREIAIRRELPTEGW